MRAAVIEPTGTVINVVLCGDDYNPGDGLTVVELADDSPVGPGWTHTDGEWVEPTPVDPEPAPLSFESRIQAQMDEMSDLMMEILLMGEL